MVKVVGHGVRPPGPARGPLDLLFDVDGNVDVHPGAVHGIDDPHQLPLTALLVVHEERHQHGVKAEVPLFGGLEDVDALLLKQGKVAALPPAQEIDHLIGDAKGVARQTFDPRLDPLEYG